VSATDQLTLHPGFGHTWPTLRAEGRSLLIDTANVLGATANGWWRDRESFTTSLLQRWRGLATHVVSGPPSDDGVGDVPGVPGQPTDIVVTSVTAVLEGKARTATAPPGVHVVLAGGSGDDAIVQAVADQPERYWLVVTADRELRQRLADSGGSSVGSRGARVAVASPRWLLGLSLPAARP